jgi:hypothetical protein
MLATSREALQVRLESFSRKSKWLVVAALFALCVAPTFISYQPYLFTWDDSEYLTRSTAVSWAFWSGNVQGLVAAMVSQRPPAMTLLGLPWGMPTTWDVAGNCFFTLAAVTSLLAALCLYLLLRIGVKPLFLVLASVCVFASLGPYPPGADAHAAATSFLSDSLFAWTTLAAVLLIPYEARMDCPSIKTAVLHGLLWGMILSLGAMTKISFMYFVVSVIPILFLIRLYHSGLRLALASLGACACSSLPAAVYLLRWGGRAFAYAKMWSFGPLTNLYYQPLSQFLGTAVRELPGLLLSFLLMAAALVYLVIKRRLSLLGPDLLALLVMIVFGIVVLSSPSRDIRFDFPAIVALPFLTGILMSGKGQSVSRRSAALAAGLVFCGLLAAGVPTRHRAKIECLSRSYAVLAMATQCNAKSVLLATDSPTLNAYLLDLGRMYSESEVGRTGTLASNAMAGAPIELDYRVISEYDQVVFQDRPALSPPFTNQRVLEYERYVQSLGFSAIRVGNDIKVYSRFCRP